MTLSVNSPGGNELGTYIQVEAGNLATIGGQGLATVPAGLTHSSPKAMSGGVASFSFQWTVPSGSGASRFDVSTLVANGNNSSSGDKANRGFFDFVYGCTPATYYRDLDGDGFGYDGAPRIDCADQTPSGYAPLGGDCADSDPTVFPTAVEVCNQKDDDCNGEVDDDAIPVTLFPDADGDGFYGALEGMSTDTIMGCVPTPEYAAEPGDCAPEDPAVHPAAEEVCNLIDDNCDNRVDEQVRPRCGVGWCVRESSNCNPDVCLPGEPVEEKCNLLDDDCDGLVDEDAPCDAGLTCIAGDCRADETAGAATPQESSCALQPGDEGDPTAVWLVLALGAALAQRRLRQVTRWVFATKR
jgi:hypothetical protein